MTINLLDPLHDPMVAILRRQNQVRLPVILRLEVHRVVLAALVKPQPETGVDAVKRLRDAADIRRDDMHPAITPAAQLVDARRLDFHYLSPCDGKPLPIASTRANTALRFVAAVTCVPAAV